MKINNFIEMLLDIRSAMGYYQKDKKKTDDITCGQDYSCVFHSFTIEFHNHPFCRRSTMDSDNSKSLNIGGKAGKTSFNTRDRDVFTPLN